MVYDDIEPKFSKYYWGMPNHWRKDDNPPKSTIPKLLSLYFSFLWNDDFPKVRKIAGILHRFRNRINGLPLVYGLKEEDEHWAIPLLQHFPVGGGFINQHNDPLEPQKCVVSLTLIKDFKTGGLYTNPTGKVKIPLEPMIGPGDLFVFRPDIFHGVDPIDPDLPKDYRNPFGRWRMSCILSSKS